MTAVRRYDLLGPLMGAGSGARLDSTTGFLHAPVRATRTGVFEYRRPDGSISRELRHPEDVFDADSLESLKRVVATKGHPRDADGNPIDVTTDNVKKLQVGHGGDEIRRESVLGYEHPTVGLTVTDAPTVRDIAEGGKTMVSMGYRTIVVEESGEYLGVRYDRRHTQIRYNHVAVAIDRGRGGSTVAFNLDEDDAELVANEPGSPAPPTRKHDSMPTKIKIDGVEVSLEDAGTAGIIQRALEKRDTEITGLRTAAKTATDEHDATKAKLDQAAKDLKDAQEKAKSDEDKPEVGKLVGDVLDTIGAAAKVVELDKADDGKKSLRDELLELKGDDLPAAIRKHVVLHVCADEKLEGKSDAYFEARFDMLVEAAADTDADSTGKLAAAVHKAGRRDSDDPKAPKSREDEDKALDKRLDDVFGVADPLSQLDRKHRATLPNAAPAA